MKSLSVKGKSIPRPAIYPRVLWDSSISVVGVAVAAVAVMDVLTHPLPTMR
jgi:hypothetical protein